MNGKRSREKRNRRFIVRSGKKAGVAQYLLRRLDAVVNQFGNAVGGFYFHRPDTGANQIVPRLIFGISVVVRVFNSARISASKRARKFSLSGRLFCRLNRDGDRIPMGIKLGEFVHSPFN